MRPSLEIWSTQRTKLHQHPADDEDEALTDEQREVVFQRAILNGAQRDQPDDWRRMNAERNAANAFASHGPMTMRPLAAWRWWTRRKGRDHRRDLKIATVSMVVAEDSTGSAGFRDQS
jgi:hypothetical protein